MSERSSIRPVTYFTAIEFFLLICFNACNVEVTKAWFDLSLPDSNYMYILYCQTDKQTEK
uniref:Uncharacterized protein n=1 Tax=Glossina palpalis gambiensis TaxID=67801 RepID=A0A1B0BD84_9MUSC